MLHSSSTWMPSPHSATTSMSSSISMMRLSPSRVSWWSSAVMIRILLLDDKVMPLLSHIQSDRYQNGDLRPLVRRGFDVEPAVQQLHPLPHADQAEVGAFGHFRLQRLGVEAFAVVFDDQLEHL